VVPKKRYDEPFVMLPQSLLQSYALRAASRACRQVIDRICIEHMAHAGTHNGKLIVRKVDFLEYGIGNDQIAPAEREACALGIVILTKRGRAGNAEHRAPHQWGLAFLKDKKTGAMVSTAWKRFQSLQEARAVAAEARRAKDTAAVSAGKRRAERRKAAAALHFPVRETSTETGQENQDRHRSGNPGLTFRSEKPGPLSTSSVYPPTERMQ
jgi:hypothetical protein